MANSNADDAELQRACVAAVAASGACREEVAFSSCVTKGHGIFDKLGRLAKHRVLALTGILPEYFSSEWSFVQFHMPEVTRYIVAFGAHNTVMMVGLDSRCIFGQVNGGQMTQKEYFIFLKVPTLQDLGHLNHLLNIDGCARSIIVHIIFSLAKL